LLDWEYAKVASPRHDVAYALEHMAPFRSDELCLRWLGLEIVQRLAAEGHERQVALIAAGYLDELRARIAWSEHNRHLFS
jgi:thiamine kinase-like enzyme